MTYKEKLLESQMVTYTDLLTVPVGENQEPLVVIGNDVIPSRYQVEMFDMAEALQNRIFVRLSVYERLRKAQNALQKRNSNLSLFVTYGYRSLEVQTRKFLEQLRETSMQTFFSNPVDLYEEVHRFIAVPTVAGHPTGGAVDLVIVNQTDGQFLDFGSRLYDFSNKDCYTFAPDISELGKSNRALLRSCMIDAGFAPFDGEWWHFCYGDREWAYYYKRSTAFYEQLPADKVKESVI